MSDLLFAVPWWIPTLLAVIGVVVAVNGNRSQVAKVRNIGLGLVLLAIVWAVVSYLVETDKEKVEKGTRQFIQNAVDRDWVKFRSHLAPSAVLIAGSDLSGAEPIAQIAKLSIEAFKLTSARIQKLEIEQTGPVITARLDLFTQQDALPPTTTSSWLFTWEKGAQEWQIREIRLITLNGVPGDQVVVPKGGVWKPF